VRILKFSLE